MNVLEIGWTNQNVSQWAGGAWIIERNHKLVSVGMVPYSKRTTSPKMFEPVT